MSPKQKTIPAVAYCRKSTMEERTEKSIADQSARIRNLKPPEDGARYEIVRWYDRDKGVPGWKRGASRPDYNRLVNELKETGAKAIIVDDMDRFSRADELEVMSDVQALREHHGIRYIHAVNQGCIDLVSDQFAAMKIAMSAMAGHEFSTRLSRRIANARLDAANKGLRSGGEAPYGMENDGKGGLKFGKPKNVKTVRWIFDQFVNHLKSLHWIAAELNRQGCPARKGGKWHVAAITGLLKRREYRGDFAYNRKKSGQFHFVNDKREVVRTSNYHEDKPKAWQETAEGMIVVEGVYKPLVDPKLFDKAQKRLEGFAMKGSRRPRADGYPLSRVLVCDHCGKPLYGCHPTGRKYRVYRCSSPAKTGTCSMYEVREELILPLVLRILGEEIDDIKKLLSAPPDELRAPNRAKAEQRESTERERGELTKQIARAEENILFVEDARTRQALDRKLTEWRDRLEKLDAELTEAQPREGYTKDDLARLTAWWDDFTKRAVSVPMKGKLHPAAAFWQDPESEEQSILLDARVVNEALHTLGAEVRLRWKTEQVKLPSGKEVTRHILVRGRFRLGQQVGTLRLARYSWRSMRAATPPHKPCSGC